MTREEKIALLIDELEDIRCNSFDADTDEDKTLKEVVKAIKELEQEPTYTSKVAQKAYEDGKKDGYVKAKVEQISESDDNVLDKIRTEIEALPKTYPFINHIDTYVKEDDVKKIINKYKAESEGK